MVTGHIVVAGHRLSGATKAGAKAAQRRATESSSPEQRPTEIHASTPSGHRLA
jgi:hypothetical protein